MLYNTAAQRKPSQTEMVRLPVAGEEGPTLGLQSLATLAAARALEMGGEVVAEAGVEQPCPIRKRLNLRRKCSWTPRHEPVSLQQTCILRVQSGVNHSG